MASSPKSTGAAPKRKRARRLARDERRAQILSVATEIFREKPYGEVSLDDIAERAGIARGLINHHFGTKRDLYVEVVRRIMAVPEIPVPEYVHGQTLRERLDVAVDTWLAAIERNRDIWLDSVQTSGMGDPEIARITEEARETGAMRVAQVMGLGPVQDLSPERMGLLRAWEALAEALVRQWLEYRRLTKQQVRDLVVETAVRMAEGLIEEMAAVIGEGAATPKRSAARKPAAKRS